jgi:cytolethal distending toxin subunit A
MENAIMSFRTLESRTACSIQSIASVAALAMALTGTLAPIARAEGDGEAALVTLVNVKTGKCLTIAGGVSTDNNVTAVQFNCDGDPSRRWYLIEKGGNSVYQLKNAQTGKCLTIAGGVSTDNNVTALQFNCDSHPSRTWSLNDVTGGGVYQIRNVQTNKCLTIAGGVSTNNNVEALQFDCDSDPSRRWTFWQTQ